MVDNKEIQEKINLFRHFSIRFIFKDKDFREELDERLKEINTLRFSKFEQKFELKSTILENIFPELKTNLTLNFEKYQIRIEKDKITITFPKERETLFSELLYYPKIFSRLSQSIKKEKGKAITIEEIKEIDEIIKLYLIEKLIEVKKPLDLSVIELFSVLSFPKKHDFSFINKIIKTQIESDKDYGIPSIDFDIREGDNVFSVYLEKDSHKIIVFSIYKNNISWTMPIMELLNKNIDKIKEIMEELKL